LPVLIAKVTGAFNSGNISVVLSDGEVCKGHWAVVPRVQAPKGASTATAPATNGMSSVWDTVYGPGFYVSHVLGTRLYVQARVAGDRGALLNVEMYRENVKSDNIAGAIKGVAKDNQDNIYKITF
jgi:hypothetical protein